MSFWYARRRTASTTEAIPHATLKIAERANTGTAVMSGFSLGLAARICASVRVGIVERLRTLVAPMYP